LALKEAPGMSRMNPLTALVLVLEAAADRLKRLYAEREAAHRADLAARECEGTARAMSRLLDADLGHALVHLYVAKDFANEAQERCTATHGPAELDDSLLRARENAKRAIAHLHLVTEEHAEAACARVGYADERAWHLRLGAAAPERVCAYCHGPLDPSADPRFCSPACEEFALGRPEDRDACPECGARVFDDRFCAYVGGHALRYCSTDCGAQAARRHVDAAAAAAYDVSHELDAHELADATRAADGYADDVDLDDLPF